MCNDTGELSPEHFERKGITGPRKYIEAGINFTTDNLPWVWNMPDDVHSLSHRIFPKGPVRDGNILRLEFVESWESQLIGLGRCGPREPISPVSIASQSSAHAQVGQHEIFAPRHFGAVRCAASVAAPRDPSRHRPGRRGFRVHLPEESRAGTSRGCDPRREPRAARVPGIDRRAD
jgi:hypothetical protein